MTLVLNTVKAKTVRRLKVARSTHTDAADEGLEKSIGAYLYCHFGLTPSSLARLQTMDGTFLNDYFYTFLLSSVRQSRVASSSFIVIQLRPSYASQSRVDTCAAGHQTNDL